MDTEFADLPPLPNHTLSNSNACITTPEWAKQKQPGYPSKESSFLSSILSSSSLESKPDQNDNDQDDDDDDEYFYITKVRDFAYPPVHPLHSSVFPTSPWESTTTVPTVKEHGSSSSSSRSTGRSNVSSTNSSTTVLPTTDSSDFPEITGRAIALFDFESENDNEIGLVAGQHIWVSYRHGQGWLVAQDPETGESGLVPEEYVQMVDPLLQRALIAGNRNYDDDDDDDDDGVQQGYAYDEEHGNDQGRNNRLS